MRPLKKNAKGLKRKRKRLKKRRRLTRVQFEKIIGGQKFKPMKDSVIDDLFINGNRAREIEINGRTYITYLNRKSRLYPGKAKSLMIKGAKANAYEGKTWADLYNNLKILRVIQ